MQPCAISDVHAEHYAYGYSYIDKYTNEKVTVIHIFDPKYGGYCGCVHFPSDSLRYMSDSLTL